MKSSVELRETGCPLDVAARIAASIAEELERVEGKLEAVDVAALNRTFSCYEEEVKAQIAELGKAPSSGEGKGWALFGPEGEAPERIGPYRLGRRLGGGAAGEVFEARDERLGRVVALKILRNPWGMDREARAQAILSEHPNICVVHGVEEQEGLAFIVMELVRGISMDRLVARRQREEAASQPGGGHFRDTARALAGAARALSHAHRSGVVHRDIKPANLLMDEEGRVKVTDFSHAKGDELQRISRTGQFVGTVAYASPEQVEGRRDVGPATDIWSLGATLYEMVTLALPFPGRSELEVIARIREGRMQPPRQINPRIPIDLERIILRCLEREPELRYEDGMQLAVDLEHFAAGEAILQSSVGIWRRIWYGLKRPTHRSVRALLLLLGLAVALGWGATTMVSTTQELLALKRFAWGMIERAEQLLEKGIKERDHTLLVQSRLLAIDALAVDLDDQEVLQRLKIICGRAAFERNDMEGAAEMLGDADEISTLTREHRLDLARALFATGKLAEARKIYEALGEKKELAWLHAFENAGRYATRTPGAWRFLSAAPLNLGPASVLVIERIENEGKIGGILCLYPGGLHEPHDRQIWFDKGELPKVGALCIGDLLDNEEPELIIQGGKKLFVAKGPFSREPPEWHELPDPVWEAYEEYGWSDEDWWEENAGMKPRQRHLALLPATGIPGCKAQIVVGRYRVLARLWVRQKLEDGKPISLGWHIDHYGSDMKVLRRVEWKGSPAILAGWGPWNGFRFDLLRTGNRRKLLPIASATLGAACDAISVPLPDRDENLILCTTGGAESFQSERFFGSSTKFGWEHGVHAFTVDPVTKSLAPQSSMILPRPQNVQGRLHYIELDHDELPTILFSQFAYTSLYSWTRRLIWILDLQARDERFKLRPRRLHLPGFVLAVLPAGNGECDLIIEHSSEEILVIRIHTGFIR